MIKICKEELSHPLVYLINLSLEKGEFPEELKQGLIKPIFKKGEKQLCSNYRPITILSTLSKTFEKVMYTRLNSFLMKNNILSSNQFGFQKNKSTNQALIQLITCIVDSIDTNQKSLAIFLDIIKAFDNVNHNILLENLELIGIRVVALKWF